ncbi:MAG: hypothetical protein ACFFFH_13455 [Candidatus Thorarchaeota archaeon]
MIRLLPDYKLIIKALWLAVFSPGQVLENQKRVAIIMKYGWIFIMIRWVYYSFFFAFFRDYHGSWEPFSPVPFGMSIDTYAFFQIRFSIFFGIFLMFCIALCLWFYLYFKKKPASLFMIFNILGITFFLPFLILQPFDLIIINTVGWVMYIIVPLHSAFLIWEAVVTMRIFHHRSLLTPSEQFRGVLLILSVWIILSFLFWR